MTNVRTDLEIRHLRLVEAVAAEGGVTRAAGRLNLTQSALSQQLRDIENRLGSPLLQRTARKMALTPAGEKVRECARRVLAELESVEDAVRGDADRTGRLRITTECYSCYYWLPRQLRELRRRYPRVDVSSPRAGLWKRCSTARSTPKTSPTSIWSSPATTSRTGRSIRKS